MGSESEPLSNTVFQKLQVAFPQVSDDLSGMLAQAVTAAVGRIYRAFPHEKQRTGMIILELAKYGERRRYTVRT